MWELIGDPTRHPEWWPRVLEVHCEGLEEGCTYREVVKAPFGGEEEMNMRVERLEDCRNLSIRCLNTGSYVRFALAGARGGTFVDGEMGMEARDLGHRVFDAVAGQRYFRNWLQQTFEGLDRSARSRAAA